MKLTDILNEAKNDTYFNSATEAVTYAREAIEKRGYVIDEDSWHTQIAMGGRYGRLRPSVGKYHKFSVEMKHKNHKKKTSYLQIQLYGMNNSYELNFYVG